MMLFVILQSMLMMLLSTPSLTRHLTVATTRDDSWIWIWNARHSGLGLTSLIRLVLLMGKWKVLFLRTSSFRILGLSFSSKLDWSSYIISVAKTASEKIEALIRSMKFLFPKVFLYLYKSILQPCMECCCHAWVGALSCYLEMLDKSQKWVCRTVGP